MCPRSRVTFKPSGSKVKSPDGGRRRNKAKEENETKGISMTETKCGTGLESPCRARREDGGRGPHPLLFGWATSTVSRHARVRRAVCGVCGVRRVPLVNESDPVK